MIFKDYCHATRSLIRQRDLRLAVETARAAGLEVGRVEIDRDGKIVALAGKGSGL